VVSLAGARARAVVAWGVSLLAVLLRVPKERRGAARRGWSMVGGEWMCEG
jgi:hypothetical protein